MRRVFRLAAGFALAVGSAGLRAVETSPKETAPHLLADLGSRLATPRPAAASDDGLLAIRQMKPPPGTVVTLWAAEPLLANPVGFAFDERGRAFVAETYRARSSALDVRDYPWMFEADLACRTLEERAALVAEQFGAAGVSELSQETEVVRVLEDTDDDGAADATAVYAAGFNTALDGVGSGVLVRDGQVWFTNVPSLWKFTGRAKADTREELSRGYGVRFGFTGHDLRNPVFGPDGKIYFSCGDRGARVVTREGGVIDVPDSGAVFRCDPDGARLELFAWGLCNPQGLCFNDNGDLFAADGDAGQGDEERLVQIVAQGDSGWRIGYQESPRGDASPWLAEGLWRPRHAGQAAYLLPPVCNIEDGPTGMVSFPGMGLGALPRDSILVAHEGETVAGSGLYSYKVKPDGAGYAIAEAAPLLLSVVPSAVQFGPDCRLYFAVRADGNARTPRGRIYALGEGRSANEPFVAETRRLLAQDFATEVPEELAHLLGHPDWRLRLKAEEALVGHGPDGLAVLIGVLANQEAPKHARLHAAWAVGRLAPANPGARALLPELLRDGEPEVRAQAAKLLGECRVAEAWPGLVAALRDPQPRVRFFAAQSLGRLGPREAVAPLFALLRENQDTDAYVRHAAVLGLAGCSDAATLAAVAKAGERAERLGAVLALRRQARPEIAEFLGDADPLIGREAALAINDTPIPAAFPALAERLAAAGAEEAVVVRVINAHFRLGRPENAGALARYAGRRDAPERLRVEALQQLAAWPAPPARDRVVGVFRPLTPATRDPAVARASLAEGLPALLAADAGPAVQLAALGAIEMLDLRAAAEALAALVLDPRQPDAVRAEGLLLLERWQAAQLAALVKCAIDGEAPLLRLAALPAAARLLPDRLGPVLDRLVTTGDVNEQKGALSFLRTRPLPLAGSLLAAQLEKLAAGHVAAEVQLELIQAAERQSAPAVRTLLADREAALAASGDPLADRRVSLAGGNAARGAEIFNHQPVRACVRCHDAGHGGGTIGPNLAAVARRSARAEMLESVLLPGAKVIHGYETVTVTLKSGDVTVGKVVREGAETLRLRTLEGRIVRLKKADIVRREHTVSAMPPIYPFTLSPGQLRDVMEFLAGLNAAPTPPRQVGELRALRRPVE